MWDGYIEKESKLNDFINELRSMKIDIIFLHTSGHADKKAFLKLNKIVNPNKTIIIHTEDSKKGYGIFNNVLDINDCEYINVE